MKKLKNKVPAEEKTIGALPGNDQCFPIKLEGPQLKASGNEVAIESIEIAHEGLELQDE